MVVHLCLAISCVLLNERWQVAQRKGLLKGGAITCLSSPQVHREYQLARSWASFIPWCFHYPTLLKILMNLVSPTKLVTMSRTLLREPTKQQPLWVSGVCHSSNMSQPSQTELLSLLCMCLEWYCFEFVCIVRICTAFMQFKEVVSV